MENEFEFDPTTSLANREKRGIDFAEAQDLWNVPALQQGLPFQGEPREMRTGMISGRLWSAVYTERGASIRIISVRRARKDEAEDYGHFIAEQGDDDEH